MLVAAVEDLLKASVQPPNQKSPEPVEVVTTWNPTLGEFPLLRRHEPNCNSLSAEKTTLDRLTVHYASTPDKEFQLFKELCAKADAVLLIAPELDEVLLKRRTLIETFKTTFLGSNLQAVTLFSDKLQTFHWLLEHRLPTVPTFLLERDPAPTGFSHVPAVIKRRDGAGAVDTRLIQSEAEWDECVRQLRDAQRLHLFVWQPFVEGLSLSCTALLDNQGRLLEIFPVGEQQVSVFDEFRYHGGLIPAPVPEPIKSIVEQTVRHFCESAQGLHGLVGLDFLIPLETVDTSTPFPLIVDVNPRLTTSYVGYRQLTEQNILEHLLAAMLPSQSSPHRLSPLFWRDTEIRFDSTGRVSSP